MQGIIGCAFPDQDLILIQMPGADDAGQCLDFIGFKLGAEWRISVNFNSGAVTHIYRLILMVLSEDAVMFLLLQ
jgi:hypothetical protein